jgi:hypothetical protein
MIGANGFCVFNWTSSVTTLMAHVCSDVGTTGVLNTNICSPMHVVASGSGILMYCTWKSWCCWSMVATTAPQMLGLQRKPNH